MAHQSLYRKYRPTTYQIVKGQQHITQALNKQVATGTVGHAYIFAGSRGLGKTTIARIFANALGAKGSDLYEIDAASNNSVDDIRAITENIYTLPFESDYKVYILDEAHMLSKGAWNALLKTLEEPPAYVIFILATTELEKIPETVQSRCQVFEFRKPSRADLAAFVTEIAEAEGKKVEPAAADLISLLAEHSYRDALSVLEKVISATEGKKVSREDAEQVTGAPQHELVAGFVQALAQGSNDAALTTLREAVRQGADMPLYLSLVLEYVRTVLLVRFAPELRKELNEELGSDAYAEIEKLAQMKESKLSHSTLRVLLDAADRMRFSPIPSLPLELAVFELLGQD